MGNWSLLGLGRAALVTVALGAGFSAGGVEIADLQPGVLEELKTSGLVAPGAPIPGFSWTLENKRPFRKPRLIEETFTAAPSGLSPVQMSTTYTDGSTDQGEYLSARGLLRVGPKDKTTAVTFEEFKVPPVTGAHFKVNFVRDGNPVKQSCVVGAASPAAELMASLPGEAVKIECQGEGQYAGIGVHVKSEIFYLERLGMFLDYREVLDTPIGKLENRTRVTEFKWNGSN